MQSHGPGNTQFEALVRGSFDPSTRKHTTERAFNQLSLYVIFLFVSVYVRRSRQNLGSNEDNKNQKANNKRERRAVHENELARV